jgi:glycosyltransferase involved in cell wall biosynthesis
MTGRAGKIAFVATEDWFFASHFLPMARAAREMDLDVVVIARERIHRQVIESTGARLIALEAERRSLDPRGLWAYVSRLKAILAHEQPSIVHMIALKPIVLGGMACRLAGIERRVNALTGLGFIGARQDWLGDTARLVARSLLTGPLDGGTVRFLFENPDDPVTLGLDPANADKVTIVGGAGVDPLILTLEPLPWSPPVKFAFMSRMLWSKGPDLAVQALAKARAAGADVALSLVGAPDPSNPKAIPAATLEDWSRRPGLTWYGPTRDIAQVWRQHHVCVLPSRGGEGLPRVLLEAAACGRALITTDVPGCRSFVRDGIDGRVVARDDADALAEAMITLARAPGLVERMGQAARARLLDGHTERDVMEGVKGLWRSMLRVETAA